MHNKTEDSESTNGFYLMHATKAEKDFVNPWPKAVVREQGYWLMVIWSIIGLALSGCLFIYGALLVTGAMALAVFGLFIGLCEMGLYTFC